MGRWGFLSVGSKDAYAKVGGDVIKPILRKERGEGRRGFEADGNNNACELVEGRISG